ncbi:hypothetical protein IMG5_205260 [Ichthyophthirius multifiliis]|uniref:Uncharacterized protein n=1 Tax=Ichthyophthirius multifiliis TaxID=5932 RepID=G0R6J2_ICHMU|nr:hypothetical protein IMG5_205260 [Ichthyophthirius multifiliis]EGR26913.1 hypothetical protein IMG5_205260 [Ichthyophthirius multifiliis]|eukprot:XP_004023797.1 hypothetical protein IMG5_205260 [Ichthyophthirius multifiliis]
MIIVEHVKAEQLTINALRVIILWFFQEIRNVQMPMKKSMLMSMLMSMSMPMPNNVVVNNIWMQIKFANNVILRVTLVQILIHVILVLKVDILQQVLQNVNYVTQIVRHAQKRTNANLVHRIIFQTKINNVYKNVINKSFEILMEFVNHVLLIVQIVNNLMNVQDVFRDFIYLIDSALKKLFALEILILNKINVKQNVLKKNLKIR